MEEHDIEFYRVASVFKCCEVLSLCGWQVGTTDPKCVFDVFAVKGTRTVKLQVRSTTTVSKKGYSSFRVGKVTYNTKRCVRSTYSLGDFDYWFFYTPKQSWMIPYNAFTNKNMVSMERFDQYKI